MLFTFKDSWGLIKKGTLLRNFCKYLPFAFIILLTGCGEDENTRPPDSEYFPLRKGLYQIYSFEQTTYSAVNPAVHEVYQLKTEVVDSFLNDIGTYTYVIYRSKRQTQNDPWQFMESWSARTSSFQAVVTEGNTSFVRFIFPASTNSRWNGNLLNNLEPDEYTVLQSGKTYQLSTGETMPDCVVIEQHNDRDILDRDERIEVYARNIGLVYKRSIVLHFCRDSQSIDCQFGVDDVIGGTEFEQVLIGYGQN